MEDKSQYLLNTNEYNHIQIKLKTALGTRHPILLKYDNFKKIPEATIEDMVFGYVFKSQPNTY